MKKAAGIIFKVLAGLILLILILLFTIPVLFRDKIKSKVEQVINESVNATVKFEGYNFTFFKNFPNLSFGLRDLSVVGTGNFEGDTLAGFKSFDLVFNLSSLFKKSGYEVKSLVMDKAVVNAIVLKDGTANWDIMKETEEVPEGESAIPSSSSSSSGLKIVLKKVALRNSSISYNDDASPMKAVLNDINFTLRGDMTMSKTDLKISFIAGDVNFTMDGVKYLRKAVVRSEIGLIADLDKMEFTFGENYFSLNDLRLNFSGVVAIPGENIDTDLQFSTESTSFKTLLSLVPAIYMADYKDLETAGTLSLKGSAKGTYSEADSTLPDITLNLSVNGGVISYPDLPEKINNINIGSELYVDGRNLDNTTFDISRFHFDLAGNPFDMVFKLRTPESDPDFTGSVNGKIDLTALSEAIPLDSINIAGIINISLKMAGKLSMIESGQYDKFKASGSVGINDMLIGMTGYPDVKLNTASMEFSPASASLTECNMNVGGKSDFSISGHLENYIPYVFKNETIKGNLSLRSNLLNVSEILSKMVSDTTGSEDTTSVSLVRIPKNIDFDFNARINSFIYDSIKAQNIKGHIIVKDGIMSIRETGMDILGGTVNLNADYDARDTLKPFIKADFDMKNIGIKDAFLTFNTIRKFAPAARGIDGKVNVQMKYESQIGNDMLPVISTIKGTGKLRSDGVTLVESATYDKMKEVLKLGDNYSNTFKDLNISFSISNGRIYVRPFDARAGNIKMNISGDQGLDQSLNYLVKTEIPRSDLGGSLNSLIDNLSSQAAKLGINYKPADILKINVKITGVFGNPVVMPDFGGTSSAVSSGIKETVGETVKQTISKTIDAGKDKLREEAEAEGNKLVAEAERKGQQLRDEAAKASENLKKEAEEQAQKLIDAASSKGTVAKLAAQRGADALKKEADKKCAQLVEAADVQAKKLVDDAKAKKEELINKL